MKKLLLFLIGMFHLNFAMELTQEAIAGKKAAVESKDKGRPQVSSSSGSGSDSSSSVIDLGENTNKAEKRRSIIKIKLDPNCDAEEFKRKIVQALKEQEEQELKEQKIKEQALKETVAKDKKEKHKSLVIFENNDSVKIPALRLGDIESGQLQNEDLQMQFDKEELTHLITVIGNITGKDQEVQKAKSALKKILQEIHETPPSSPLFKDDKVACVKKLSVVSAKHRSLTSRVDDLKKQQNDSEIETVRAARAAHPNELLEHLGINIDETTVNHLKDLISEALSSQLSQETKNKNQRTWIGGAVSLAGPIVTFLLTYYLKGSSTASSCPTPSPT